MSRLNSPASSVRLNFLTEVYFYICKLEMIQVIWRYNYKDFIFNIHHLDDWYCCLSLILPAVLDFSKVLDMLMHVSQQMK